MECRGNHRFFRHKLGCDSELATSSGSDWDRITLPPTPTSPRRRAGAEFEPFRSKVNSAKTEF